MAVMNSVDSDDEVRRWCQRVHRFQLSFASTVSAPLPACAPRRLVLIGFCCLAAEDAAVTQTFREAGPRGSSVGSVGLPSIATAAFSVSPRRTSIAPLSSQLCALSFEAILVLSRSPIFEVCLTKNLPTQPGKARCWALILLQKLLSLKSVIRINF